MSPIRQGVGLVGWLLLCYAAAAIGAMASVGAPEFYAQLTRPDWSPPASWFGPVWSTLYTLMALAAWLVWREHAFARGRTALILFICQLLANALWSWIYFEWRLGALASMEVVLLWLMIAATVAAFWPLNRLAAALLLPYLAWVGFASALTFVTWRANPQLL